MIPFLEGIYRHYKGGYYFIEGVGKHTETEEYLVFYKDAEGSLWARPLSMFTGLVKYKGELVPRFEQVEIKR